VKTPSHAANQQTKASASLPPNITTASNHVQAMDTIRERTSATDDDIKRLRDEKSVRSNRQNELLFLEH
jgi:hypothetical protein